jgi:Holliday junction resolvase RusA-like endonuclease
MSAQRNSTSFMADALVVGKPNNPADTAVVILTVVGECVPQPRPRAKSITQGQSTRILVWDPAKAKRVAWATAVKSALVEVGVTDFPIFPNHIRTLQLKATVTFYVNNFAKDLDNMLKFVIDGMQAILYENDRVVFKIVSEKKATTRGFEYAELAVELFTAQART